MIKDHKKFKEFITAYLKTLEEMLVSTKFRNKDPKFLAQLRTAERSFNFILDQFPEALVKDVFGKTKWNDLKRRRDRVAHQVSTAIDSDTAVKSRYIAYCEFLKDTTRPSSLL